MNKKVNFAYKDVPRYQIDLDSDPSTRWNNVIDDYKYRCKKVPQR